MASPGRAESPHSLDGPILDLEGDLFPLEGWAAAEPSLLDSLGVGEIESSTINHYGDTSFTTGAAAFPPPPAATAFVDPAASIADTADTSQMQDSSMDTGRSGKVKRGPRPRLFKKHRCQADGCHANLATYSFYYQRNHICVEHLKAEVFIVRGVESRFCQRCGLSHALTEFDGKRKSCRRALEKHNARRKARAAAVANGGGDEGTSGSGAGASGRSRGAAQGGGDFAIPGVADLSGWDPQLAKELEALLHDDPIIGLPPLGDPTAAAAPAAAAAAWPMGAVPGGLPPLHMPQLPNLATVGSNQLPGMPPVELNCDGEPLSPTLLQLARAGAPGQQPPPLPPQAVPHPGAAFQLPSLEHLAQHSERAGQSNGAAAPNGAPLQQQMLLQQQQQLVGAMALQQPQMAPQQQQQQQQPVQFVVLAPPGMQMPAGMPQPGAFPTGVTMAQQAPQQQMQWVLMPSNMVMMPQPVAAAPEQQQQQQEQAPAAPQAAASQPGAPVEDSGQSTPHS